MLIEGAEVGGRGNAVGDVRSIVEGVEFGFGGAEGEAVFWAYVEEEGECSVQNFGQAVCRAMSSIKENRAEKV